MTDWTERDARREFHERVMADQRASARQQRAEFLEPTVAWGMEDGWTALDIAYAVVDAMVEDGIVFARISDG